MLKIDFNNLQIRKLQVLVTDPEMSSDSPVRLFFFLQCVKIVLNIGQHTFHSMEFIFVNGCLLVTSGTEFTENI